MYPSPVMEDVSGHRHLAVRVVTIPVRLDSRMQEMVLHTQEMILHT